MWIKIIFIDLPQPGIPLTLIYIIKGIITVITIITFLMAYCCHIVQHCTVLDNYVGNTQLLFYFLKINFTELELPDSSSDEEYNPQEEEV